MPANQDRQMLWNVERVLENLRIENVSSWTFLKFTYSCRCLTIHVALCLDQKLSLFLSFLQRLLCLWTSNWPLHSNRMSIIIRAAKGLLFDVVVGALRHLQTIQHQKWVILSRGGGGGQVVSVLTLHSDNQSSILADGYIFCSQSCVWKERI